MTVPYHGALDVEAAVADEDDDVTLLRLTAQIRRRAAEHFSFGSWLTLRQLHIGKPSLFLQKHFRKQERGVELDDSHQEQRPISILLSKLLIDALDHLLDVKFDFYKNIERILDHQIRYRYQTTVAIVDDEVAIELFAGDVIHTACAVRHIAENQALYLTEFAYDIRYKRTMHQQPLRKLQRHFHHLLSIKLSRLHHLLLAGQNFVDGLRNLIIVIPR